MSSRVPLDACTEGSFIIGYNELKYVSRIENKQRIFKKYLCRRLDNLFLLDLFAEDGVEKERGGTVVDQPGRLLQYL